VIFIKYSIVKIPSMPLIEKPLFGSGLRNSNKLAYFSRFFGVASYQPSGANYIERRKLVNPPIRPRDQGLGTRTRD
jgi:hypothetical protein